MGRKRVQNATRTELDGIKFRSKLEAAVYQTLRDNGINPDYEQLKYILVPGFETVVNGKKEKIRPITYTPDFSFIYNNILYIIEVKGFITDGYKLKRKLILQRLATEPVMFYEVKSTAQMKEILDEIKQLEVATTNSAR